ncbi:unnamed protein product [Colias eurytheme]|nr:unnamed protein product [Colias eurytheme]
MPTESNENLVEFTECLSEMTAIIDSHNVQSVFMLGDYNAHPGESFATELLTFCAEQSWSCVDLELMPADSHTFVSDAHGCRRWLDHCLVTSAARQSVSAACVLYNTYWSDHYPVSIRCAVGGDGDDSDDKEKEEEAERERQEAIREAEERRKEKHRKMEEEREKMRQEIRDKYKIPKKEEMVEQQQAEPDNPLMRKKKTPEELAAEAELEDQDEFTKLKNTIETQVNELKSQIESKCVMQ